MYIHKYVDRYRYIHIYVFIYIFIYLHTCIHTHLHTYLCTYRLTKRSVFGLWPFRVLCPFVQYLKQRSDASFFRKLVKSNKAAK